MRRILRFSAVTVAVLVALGASSLSGQPLKPIGPLGIWRAGTNPVYAAPGIPESTRVQDAFAFGDFWNMNDLGDEGWNFQPWLDSACRAWNCERYVGVIRPPSEGGTINIPDDTTLFTPGRGMIQGGVRFSRLASIYGQIYGVNIDDFGGLDTQDVHDIRDALQGRYVDSAGVVDHDSPATTPWLKLFVVIYPHRTTLPPKFAPFIDGINLWYYNQDGLYTQVDDDVDAFRTSFPGKEINFGIYVYNSDYHWMTPASISYLYQHLFSRYEDGSVNGTMLFAGHWIVIPNISRTQWDDIHLPALLDSVCYPYVGQGQGRVYDQTKAPLEDVHLRCYAIGKTTGDTLVRSMRLSDSAGAYSFSAWASNEPGESTRYYVEGWKESYAPATVSGYILPGGLTSFPDLVLAGTGASEVGRTGLGTLSSTPNPSSGPVTIDFALSGSGLVRLGLYDRSGRKVRTLVSSNMKPGHHSVRWDGLSDVRGPVSPGIYFCRFETASGVIQQKIIVSR